MTARVTPAGIGHLARHCAMQACLRARIEALEDQSRRRRCGRTDWSSKRFDLAGTL